MRCPRTALVRRDFRVTVAGLYVVNTKAVQGHRTPGRLEIRKRLDFNLVKVETKALVFDKAI